ncbi:MAG: hypothetical protein HY848_12295 [Betaproteobacteria bacterium]|nr:hypothetical protein [Betaproteobacteria bacterium]
MRKIAAALLLFVALIGAALFWLSGNIDGLIKDALENYGSAMTQAKVSVNAVKIAPADGKGTISNLAIANPAGFKTAYALKVGRIDIDIDIASVATDVIVIRRIAVVAPDVIYEKGEAMTNFDAIQKNIAAYLGPAGGKKEGRRLIVELLTIRDAKAQASAAFMNGKTVSLPLPDITLKNIGRAKGGITPGELGQEVAGALKAKLTGAVSFDRLMKSAGDALDKAGSAIKGLFK